MLVADQMSSLTRFHESFLGGFLFPLGHIPSLLWD